MQLILASSSKNRLKLLNQVSLKPDQIFSPDIDETPLKAELPARLAERLSKEKAIYASKNFSDAFIIAADTVTACGRRILSKASNDDDVRNSLKLLSGRRHQVYTSVCILKLKNMEIEKLAHRLVKTSIKLKRLTAQEIEEYVGSKEGIGSSGGCTIDSIGQSYVLWMGGSYSNVIGLPLYETKSLLLGLGYKKNS